MPKRSNESVEFGVDVGQLFSSTPNQTMARCMISEFPTHVSRWLALLPLVLFGACTKGAPPASLLDSGSTISITSSTVDLRPTTQSASASTSATGPTLGEQGGNELQLRGKKLFEAIQKNEPDLAMSIFVTKEIWASIKELRDPTAAWEKLYKQFKVHIYVMHKRLGNKVNEAEFESLEINPRTQVNVAVKRESNKVPFKKVTMSTIRYKVRSKAKSLTISTMIDHDGKWYVTHLRK